MKNMIKLAIHLAIILCKEIKKTPQRLILDLNDLKVGKLTCDIDKEKRSDFFSAFEDLL
jgi:hypothetical protein